MTGIRLKSIVKIPANIQGENGITVEHSGGQILIGIDEDALPTGFNWRGPWSSLTNYEIDDGVGHEGASYIAIAANLNSEPPSADWDVMAQASSSPVVDDQITPPMLDADTSPKQLAFRDRLNVVSRAGDTMTGHLVLPTGPAASNAVRKDYVDAAITTAATDHVLKAGDTMTGHLVLPITPAASNAVRRDYVDAADLVVLATQREKLTAGRNYYVRTDGSDSNNGLANTAGGAFLTIQKAIDTIWKTIDTQGFSVAVNVGAGTFTGTVAAYSEHVGGGSISIIGAGMASTTISTTSANCVVAYFGARLSVSGMKLQTTTSGSCLLAGLQGQIDFNNIDFGACAGSHCDAVEDGLILSSSGTYTISGGAISHWHSHNSYAKIKVSFCTITLTGTPAFSAYFAGVAAGLIECVSNTFTGSATGQKFYAHLNGYIYAGTEDLNYLPGSTAGTVTEFGAYQSTTGVGNFLAQAALFSGNVAINSVVGSIPGVGNTNVGFSYLASINALFVSRADYAPYYGNVNVDGPFMIIHRSGTACGNISVTSTTTVYNTVSDAALKEDLKSFDAGNIIDNTKVYDFAWKSTKERAYGVIAQQANEVYPLAVTHTEKDEKGGREEGWFVDYSKYVPVLLQELKAMRERVAALEGKLASKPGP